ncbi:MAG: sulfite exporter TauE/SafE family protein [Rhodospirillaceae bacterium]
MDLTVLAVGGFAFLCGGLIKGVVGMGLPLTSVALMSQFIDLRIAVPLLVIPILVTNALQAIRGHKLVSLLREYWTLIATACAFTFIGVYLLYNINSKHILLVLGTVITLYGLFNLFAIRVTVSEKHKPWLSPLTGLAAGLMAGMTGVIAIPTMMYFQALKLPKDIFVQALGITFFVAGTFLMIALWLEGGLNLRNIHVSALAMVPAVFGMYVGEKIRKKISEEKFRTWVFIFLCLIGLNLVRKSLY